MTNPIIQKAKDLVHLSSSSKSNSKDNTTTSTPTTAKPQETPIKMGNYPKTCKAAVISEIGAKLTIKEVPVNDPTEGQILIKVLACGVCHSDNAVQEGGMGPL
jgi:hypothetical protein